MNLPQRTWLIAIATIGIGLIGAVVLSTFPLAEWKVSMKSAFFVQNAKTERAIQLLKSPALRVGFVIYFLALLGAIPFLVNCLRKKPVWISLVAIFLLMTPILWLGGKVSHLASKMVDWQTLYVPVRSALVESWCEDLLLSSVQIIPELDSPFFVTIEKSYPWYIIDHGEGKLEDTSDGSVEAEDRVQVEHTAKCVSSHQGEHEMNFCDARSDGDITKLHIWGGLPAYASSLRITIDDDLKVLCSFEATYPAPNNGFRWRITKKEIQLRDRNIDKNGRLYGWISVQFEEGWEKDGTIIWTPYTIEGYIKPVVRKAD